MKKEKKQGKKPIVGLPIPVLLLLVTVLALGSGVAAKYIFGASGGENVFSAEEFYFTSDMLSVEGETYTLPADTKTISFSLANYEDKLRVSDRDISYTFKVDKDNPIVSLLTDWQTGTGTVVRSDSGNHQNSVSVTVGTAEKPLEPGTTYKVTVTGEAGYKKKLKATFIVSDDAPKVYKYLEKDPVDKAYVLLTVWTENVAGTASVEVKKDGLIPDTTDTALDEITNYTTGTGYGEFEFTDAESFLSTYSSRTYRFFLDVGTDINGISVKNDFIVEVDGKKAVVGEP